MVTRPVHMNPYEFVIVSALRAKQLIAGSVRRVEGDHRAATIAQMEVAEGLITRENVEIHSPAQCRWQL